VKFRIGADGKPELLKLAKIEFIDDGPGKPVGINRFIGRRPIFAFGNSDGDLQMLQWTVAGQGPRFAGLVHHTDAEREYAYDRDQGRQARQGTGRGEREGLGRGRHEAGLEDGVSAGEVRRDEMKMPVISAIALAAAICQGASAQSLTSDQLSQRSIERRAIESIIWGMPAVNYDLMLQAAINAKAKPNQVIYWSRLPDWKNQTLTPNPDVIYLMPLFDTKEVGPMVMEIPPAGPAGSITGSIDDGWQTALEDVGPAGVDKGKGGKYLVLPPGYKDETPKGYIVLQSPTYQSYALLRSNLASGSDTDVAKAVAYGKQVKVYPLSQAKRPPATIFVDAIDIVFDSTIPGDLRFFQALDRFVQHEPWIDRDRVMIDMLKSIGVEKGKTFAPDQGMQAVLKEAIGEARAWLDNRYESIFTTSFNEGQQWVLPALPGVSEGMMTNFANPNAYPVDGRGVAYSMAFFSAKHLGAGQYYLMTIRDKERKPLDGNGTYRLNVPADAPVKLYWSATVYDRASHALIRGQKWASRSSNTPKLQKNADGSVDVFFAPKAPAGKEANWVPTDANGRFEVLFRLYGPEKPFFDKKWVLPDIERIAVQ
jgi:hypothetical protein